MLDMIVELQNAKRIDDNKAKKLVDIIKKIKKTETLKDKNRKTKGLPKQKITILKKDFKSYYWQWPAKNISENVKF